jgi:hypothetical protein
MRIILQTAFTGAALLSTLMQYVAGRDTKTGKELRIAGAVFLLLSSVVGITFSLLERGEGHGSDDEAEL